MGSTFHLSNTSGETLTRLTAAPGLCWMEQIESIVFFFFSFLFLWTGGFWGGVALGIRGKGSGSWLLRDKSKGVWKKAPHPGLEREPKRLCIKARLGLGGGSGDREEVMLCTRRLFSAVGGGKALEGHVPKIKAQFLPSRSCIS